ncbi:protein kinase C and casein kinase substrate in neurons protein 1 isoform X1 [Phasianus colchicus]|uniref:protein kinase C and casein kinase substrate in neurons protein 1 isoform X1 n=1 Tax=Phasianus colchicus TaxID=9054 RepID=UPI00129E7FF3|nr:protein kinase C and casein kinase substrate in neurons protein 1 isoform X1 [Phasianus colchicus]
MSGSYDESAAAAEETTDSFWEVGNYKRTVKRIDDGHRLCNDLMNCVHERAKIEKSYAQQLTDWSKRWRQLIEKGPQYGSLERAWGAIMTEADKVSELHQDVKNSLLNDDFEKVKNWQKDAYHKQIMGGFKEAKEAEDGFRKAQKPWAKKLKELETAKKAYHLACKEEKLAMTREANSKADQSNTPEQQKKLQDKVEKCKQDVQKTQEKYEKVLDELNKCTPQYMESMEQVFEQCQQFEEKRLNFLKEVLLDIKRHLNLAESSSYANVYRELEQTIRLSDAQEDLRWFRSTSGPGMPMNWPQFEEWNPDLTHTITRKEKMKKGEGVTLTNASSTGESGASAGERGSAVSWRTACCSLGSPPDRGARPSQISSPSHPSVSSHDRGQTYSAEWSDDEGSNSFNASEANGGTNPFDEDSAGKGVRVRALYDYDGQEQDELSFKAGDELTKLGEEDEQGWCKGRLDNGQLGLYPANYVEAI